MRHRYRAAIIGAGKIGAFYSKPNNYQGILTHAHAYRKEKRVKLVAFVDVMKKKAIRAAKLWGVRAYDNLETMFKKEELDIISICTPDETHKEVLRTCLKYKPKLVFCEKPLTTNINSTKYLVKAYKKKDIILAVDYTRRWNEAVMALKGEIKKRKYGKILNIVGVYTKGILHNGSHLIDLLRFFFGEVKEAVSLAARIDWQKSDPTLDAFLRFQNGVRVHLVAADQRHFQLFELDLLFEKGRIVFTDSGNKMQFYQMIGSEPFKVLKYLKTKNTRLRTTLLKVISSLTDVLEGRGKLLCSGTEALKTQAVCEKLIAKYKKGGVGWKS